MVSRANTMGIKYSFLLVTSTTYWKKKKKFFFKRYKRCPPDHLFPKHFFFATTKVFGFGTDTTSPLPLSFLRCKKNKKKRILFFCIFCILFSFLAFEFCLFANMNDVVVLNLVYIAIRLPHKYQFQFILIHLIKYEFIFLHSCNKTINHYLWHCMRNIVIQFKFQKLLES